MVCTCSINPLKRNKKCLIHGDKNGFVVSTKIGGGKELAGEKVTVGKGKGSGKSKKEAVEGKEKEKGGK